MNEFHNLFFIAFFWLFMVSKKIINIKLILDFAKKNIGLIICKKIKIKGLKLNVR